MISDDCSPYLQYLVASQRCNMSDDKTDKDIILHISFQTDCP